MVWVLVDLPSPHRSHASDVKLLGFLNGSAVILMKIVRRRVGFDLDEVDLDSVSQSEFRAIPSPMLVRG
jgi:hypothetical protein